MFREALFPSLVVFAIVAFFTPANAGATYMNLNVGEGSCDIQIDTDSTGADVEVNGIVGVWIDTDLNEHEAGGVVIVRIVVDGVPQYASPAAVEIGNETYLYAGPTISRDPNDPDICPFSLYARIGPGSHTITVEVFCSVMNGEDQWEDTEPIEEE